MGREISKSEDSKMTIDLDDIVETMLEGLGVDQLLFLTNKLNLSSEYLMPSNEEEWLEFDSELKAIIAKTLYKWIGG